MIKSKKQMFIVIGVFALVMLLGTVTYAFFNYTRTGSSNVIKVGRISFVSKNEQTITLNNLFPIDPEEQGIMNDSTKVGTYEIDIEGDTDYVDGLEYLVSTGDVHIYTSEGKVVPISLSIEMNNLGSESSTYFTSRNSKNANIYKILTPNEIVGDQQLLVGYIKPNTTSGTKEGVNGSITIKAYLDKNKIAITDTYDGNESDENGTTTNWVDERTIISTSEWNALQASGVSFKIKVEANEGIWVGEPFYDVMKRSTVMDNINSTYVHNSTPGINFSAISSDTNGKGIYTLSSTSSDAYPIMYYRGDVDNNVLFGNFCWKVVRTTDTGGIKLIYNGNPVNNQCGNDRIIEKNQVVAWGEIGGYSPDFTYYSSDSYEYDAQNKLFRLTGDILQTTWTETDVNSLIGKYTCFPSRDSTTCSNLKKIHSYVSSSEIYFSQVAIDSSIMLDDNDVNKDNTKYNLELMSPASVGYMYGKDYIVNDTPASMLSTVAQTYFGSGFIYENGIYSLVNPIKFNISQLPTHHYTCASSNLNGSCENIRYYINFFANQGVLYANYITLSDGESIEDALDNMFTNTNDSLAKIMIDEWYRDNMTDFTSKIEDTIYCNSREIVDYGGFNPNGGPVGLNTLYPLEFNVNDISCAQKKDSFTMSSEKGNGKLQYPVGMITDREAKLAGAMWGTANSNTSYYLYDGVGYWTMTPYKFNLMSYVGRVYEGGNTGGTRVELTQYMSGFRPVISLKQGTSVSSGTGTPTNPYVIE